MGLFRWLNAYGKTPAVRILEGSPSPLVRRRFRFSGLVQGVGFRYEAMRIASQLDLAGWVQNQGDGSVIVEIEGRANYIDAFLLSIKAVPRFDITDIQAEDLPLSNSETSFKMRY